jgi:protocatechuate 3,4-dioxygenase beta subunit
MVYPSRRGFVGVCLTWPALMLVERLVGARSLQGLGQFATGPAPCKPDEHATPPAPEGPDFKAGSPERSSLVEPGMSGTRLVLTGTVSGLTCGPIKHALLDFWQADARGAYDRTAFRLRGRQFTDASGNYRLETIVPGPHDTRAPHIHVKVQAPGKSIFTTQLFFPADPRNRTDSQFKPELAMKITDGPSGKSASFDIVLNI